MAQYAVPALMAVALTGVSSYLEYARAKKDEKKKKALLATKKEIVTNKVNLEYRIKFNQALAIERTRLADVRTWAAGAGIETETKAGATTSRFMTEGIQTRQKQQLAELDLSRKYEIEDIGVSEELALGPSVAGLGTRVAGSILDVGAGTLGQVAMEGKGPKDITKPLTWG